MDVARMEIEGIPVEDRDVAARLADAFGWEFRKWLHTDDPNVLKEYATGALMTLGARLGDEEEELKRLRADAHEHERHPDYVYEITDGPRKAWNDENRPPDGDGGWIRNIYKGRGGWERFDYHEEAYWMRRKDS